MILIEAALLGFVVSILLDMYCQRRWAIITGDGHRFDRYAIQEGLMIDVKCTAKPNKPAIPEPEDTDTQEPEDTGTQEPQPSTTPPETTRPAAIPETTSPPETSAEPPGTTDPNTTPPIDDWETDEF